MPSSTSSFRNELKVVALVVVVLVAVEVFVRTAWVSYSKELHYICDIPTQADRLAGSQGRRVLIFGNSMAIADLDGPALQADLTDLSPAPLTIEIVAVDGAGMTEWYHIAKKYFARSGKMPDAMVINYHAASQDWGVRDEALINLERLVYYVDAPDVPEVVEDTYRVFGDRLHFVHAWALRSVAGRGRVRRLVLSKIIPDYQGGLSRISRLPPSERTLERQAKLAGKTPPDTPTYGRLAKLADLAAEHGVPVILVAMPYREQSEIAPALTAFVRERGIRVLDLQHPTGLTDEMYKDRAHLNAEGMRFFTPAYAKRLAPVLAEALRMPPGDAAEGE